MHKPENASSLHKTYTGQPFENVEHIVNSSGSRLFCRYWKPEGEVKGLVFHAHGFAEHCGRSTELTERMKELGLYSFAHDHVGHGESEGLRGHVGDYHTYIKDMWQHIDLIRKQYPDVPLFLFGHSMGGGLAAMAAHERPEMLKGVLLSAPLIKASPETATPVMVFMAKVLGFIAPSIRVGKLEFTDLSRDQSQVEKYKNDPLVDLQGMRAGLAVQLLRLCDDLTKILPEIDVPLFIAHSMKDKLTNVGGSKLLAEVAKSKDITTRFYEEPFHMLEHETEKFVESYFSDIILWIKQRM